MNNRLFLAIAVCMATNLASAEEEKPADKVEPTRILKGTEYKESSAARDQADRLRAELEKRMPPFPRKRPGETAPAVEADEFAKEIGEVVQAYQDVIKQYPHTEIAAYCAMRLAGSYQYRGKFDDAAELLEKTAGEFAGTREGARVALTTGVFHAQARNDQVKASKWLCQVPKPEKISDDMPDEEGQLYLSAQQQLIKCELRLDRDKDAEKRLTELKEAFPKFVTELDRFYKFEISSRDGMPRKEQKKDQ